jgi:hypothetical protein
MANEIISGGIVEELDDLALMRKRFKSAEEAETLDRVAATEAVEFYYGHQWADEIERQRKADGRPCFTLNKLPAIVRQVLNEELQNPPSIEITAEGDGANEDTAEAQQGLAKHVETHSQAELAYGNAYLYLVLGGFASWRVTHDYIPKSFDQECFIKPIWNPFSVYWDPAALEPDKSDAKFCFVVLDLSAEEHNAQYPDSELAGLKTFEGLNHRAPGWLVRDGCRVVEYYYVEESRDTLVKLTDGRVVWDNEIPKGARIATGDDGKPVRRKDTRRRVFCAHSNGVEWLRKPEELPTDDIPIVTVLGERLLVDGQFRVKGMVFDLVEAQRMFNYNSSAIAETMALGSKANWLATAEQIEPFMELWRQANSRNIAVLPYHNIPGVPQPQKIATEPPIQGMSAARMQSESDLRSISGVYDATAQSATTSPESGKAILARRWQSSTGNVNWAKHLAVGVKRTADILLKLFPVIYDTGRVMRIMGKDRQEKQIVVHAGRPETVPAELPDGVQNVIDLSAGRYSSTVSINKNYDTQQQETVQMMLSLVEIQPALAAGLADLIVGEMEFPNKQAFVDRLQKMLPPALQDQKNPLDPNALSATNAQLMQHNQTLLAQVQQLSQMVQMKTVEGQSRERVEAMKLRAIQISAAARLEAERVKGQAAIMTRAADKHFDAVHDHALADKAHIHDVMSATHQRAIAPPPPAAAPERTQ